MIFLALLFTTALLISSVSAYFSISGLTAIFPSAFLPIVSMGVVLEMGKLVTASFVYQYWNKYKVLTRGILLSMTITLSLLSSVGVYGFLTRVHVQGSTSIATSTDQVAAVQQQIDAEKSNIVFLQQGLQQTLTQGDRLVNNYLNDTTNTRTTTQTQRADATRRRMATERQTTQREIAAINANLVTLQRQRDSLAQIQRVEAVDESPLKFLAGFISPETTVETVARWFILILVFVLDPLAILLVVAGNIHRRETQPIGVKDQTQPIGVKEQMSPISHIEAMSPISHIDPPLPPVMSPISDITPDTVTDNEHKPEPTDRRKAPRTELDFRYPEKWGDKRTP